MICFNYRIEEKYSLGKALIWGNFCGHLKAAKRSPNRRERLTHLGIALLEFLPIISQIASLFEMIIIRSFGKQNNEVYPKTPINENKQLTKILVKKQQILDNNNIPLTVSPAIPKESYPPNKEICKKWIESHEEKDQPFAQKVIENIQHIRFNQLKEELKECVTELNSIFVSNKIDKYAIGFVVGKSQQWIASLATEHLDIMPSSCFGLGHQGSILGEDVFIKDIETSASEIHEKALVIFDDSSYSGTQIYTSLERLDNELKSNFWIAKRKVYLVIPFLSTKAQTYLNTTFKNFSLTVITSKTSIRMTKEIFTEREIKKLNKIQKGKVCLDSTLCYTDWRFPDTTSTIPLNKGVKTLNKKMEETSVKPTFYQIIPKKIPRPYQINKPN